MDGQYKNIPECVHFMYFVQKKKKDLFLTNKDGTRIIFEGEFNSSKYSEPWINLDKVEKTYSEVARISRESPNGPNWAVADECLAATGSTVLSMRSACRYASNDSHACRTRRPMNSVCTRVPMNSSPNRYSHWSAGAGGGVEIGFTLELLRNVRHETHDNLPQKRIKSV